MVDYDGGHGDLEEDLVPLAERAGQALERDSKGTRWLRDLIPNPMGSGHYPI